MHDAVLESNKIPLKTCIDPNTYINQSPHTQYTQSHTRYTKYSPYSPYSSYEGKIYDILTNTAKYELIYKNSVKALQKLVEVGVYIVCI